MDDLKGRKLAGKIGLTVIGTIAVIVDAKLVGIIPSVKPILDKIRLIYFRVTNELEAIILKRSGEKDF